MNFGKHARKRKLQQIDSKTLRVTNLVSSTFFKLAVFAVILLAVVGVAGGFGTLNAIVDGSPSIDHLLEEIVPEGYTTIIYDLQGNEVQRLHDADANRIYVEYDQIPAYVGWSFVAIEDERFWDHNGVDFEGVMRAMVTNIIDQRFTNPEGASTITQQIIKNNVLSNDVTLERKVQEMYLATELEKYKTKEEILELYMNTAACGRGTNGVQTASKLYFNKDVQDITLAEAAVLASITNKPTKYDPVANPENNRVRAVRILDKLLEQGYINEGEYEEAYNEDVYGTIKINAKSIQESSDYSYFVDETITRVIEDLVIQKGLTEGQASNLLYRGGLRIYITQDAKMQGAMDDAFMNEDNFPPQDEDFAVKFEYTLTIQKPDMEENLYFADQFESQEAVDEFIQSIKDEYGITEQDIEDNLAYEKALFIPQPQAAMVILDYHNGHVKALTGGRGEKKGNRMLNRATGAFRQPGSTFKLLAAYLPAIDTFGYTLATTFDDAPFDIDMPNGSTYSPGNWYKGYKGLSTVREGIVWSMNILAVKTIFDIGMDVPFDYLLDLGFTTIYESKVIDGQVFTDKTYTLPLGGLTEGVSSLELTGAYGAIANEGVYVEPIFYTRILDHDGNILLENEPTTRQVMKDTTAYLLTDAMMEVVTGGTGTTARFDDVDIPVAGKTGTTSDTKDLWFAGYTPYYASAIWMGYDEQQKMKYVRSYHKYIWGDVMEAVHTDLPYKDFNVPEGLTRASICTESGLLAIPDVCEADPRGSTVRSEYFTTATVPKDSCDVHKEVLMCTESELFATEYCPEETVERRIMIQRKEPLDPAKLDEETLASIQDYIYEIPFSMLGEYCNIHGPHTVQPEPGVDLDGDGIIDEPIDNPTDGTDGDTDSPDTSESYDEPSTDDNEDGGSVDVDPETP